MQLSAPDAHKDRRFLLHGHTGWLLPVDDDPLPGDQRGQHRAQAGIARLERGLRECLADLAAHWSEGPNTQQGMLGALSLDEAKGDERGRPGALPEGEPAGPLGPAEPHGARRPCEGRDRRSRLVTMSESGQHVWVVEAQPKIFAYHEQVLEGFSVNDVTHTLHYLLKILDTMQKVDDRQGGAKALAE